VVTPTLPSCSKAKILKALRALGCDVVTAKGKGSHVWVVRIMPDGQKVNTTVMDREHAPSEVATVLKQLMFSRTEFLEKL
jgi:hypothetical protein